VLGAIAAATGAPPAKSLNPLGLPFRPRWFRTFWTLTGREVLGFFTTPVPYVVYTGWLALNGFLFFLLLWYYTQPGADYQTPPGRLLFDNIFFWLSVWVICPALTMRLLSEEKRLGTIETLLTAPVTDVQVVLAKFASALVFFATMVATAVVYLVLLSKGSREWDWGPVLSSYLDILLVGSLYLSIGLFTSSLTQNQIVAFLAAAVLNLAIFFMNALESFVKNDSVRSVARYVSIHTHFQDMLIGIVSTRSLIYFLSGTCLFLFFSVLGLGSQRWR
jgi:ABC-2 type transport system permease protein